MKPEDRARERFTSEFGHAPAAVASAPGRVNLIGEHVDNYGGHVMPVATSWGTAVAPGPGTGRPRTVSEQGARPEGARPLPPSGPGSAHGAGGPAPGLGAPLGP